MRLIDADDILPMMERKMDMQDLYLPIHFQEMVIDEMPTVDVVQVVRCGECKYGFENYDGNFYCTKSEDLWEWHSNDRNWYCADGEKREE